jgi:hypothetical protein
MDKVWRELSRKKRVNGRSSEHFFHPASFSFSAQARAKRVRARELHEKGGDDNERIAERLETEASVLERLPKLSVEEWDARTEQDMALGYLFQQAFYLTLYPLPLRTKAELLKQMGDWFEIANQSRDLAEKLRQLGNDDDAMLLEGKALEYEEEAYWIEPDEEDPWVIDRHRGEDIVRSFVNLLACETRKLFGNPMCSTLSTIAQVALERHHLTPTKVREILRG